MELQQRFDRKRTALIVVDVQRDFCADGALPVPDGDAVVPAINELVKHFDVVVTTRDWHVDPGDHFGNPPDFEESWPKHCVANTPGAEYHPDLRLGVFVEFRKGEYAASYSGFDGVNDENCPLAQCLHEKNIKTVIVCGLATDYCVYETALAARENGFVTIVPLDACRGVSPKRMREAVNDMAASGIVIYNSLFKKS